MAPQLLKVNQNKLAKEFNLKKIKRRRKRTVKENTPN